MSTASRIGSGPRRIRAVEHFAFDVLHHEEVGALVLADVVDGGDVRGAKRRGRARLGQEARAALRIALRLGGEKLQRDLASKARVLGEIHVAHAAGAEPVTYPIVLDCVADHQPILAGSPEAGPPYSKCFSLGHRSRRLVFSPRQMDDGFVVLVGHRVGILYASDFDERRAHRFVVFAIAADDDRRPRIALAGSPEPIVVMTRSDGRKVPAPSQPFDRPGLAVILREDERIGALRRASVGRRPWRLRSTSSVQPCMSA